MKKITLILAVVFVGLISNAQKPEYYQSMGEALAQFSNCQNVDDFHALGNKFEKLASAEKGEWLPMYYHARCYILMSFVEQSDVKKKDVYLDVAEKSVNKLMEMAIGEAEVFVMRAFYLTGRLAVNDEERGPKYDPLVRQAAGKAMEIEPSNPRAKLMILWMDMGSAPFMGLDPKSFCPEAKALLAEWDNFKPKSSLYPNWGKDQAEAYVNICQ